MLTSLAYDTFHSPELISHRLAAVTTLDVETSLAKFKLDEMDLLNLLSPVAQPYIETMAQKAYQLTRQRFGNTMKLYAPLYLSNACTNSCTYCGFNTSNKLKRRTLLLEEVEEQAEFLAAQGFQSILLVSGESHQDVPVDYLATCINKLKNSFSEISIEVYPLEQDDYQLLTDQGLYGLAVYQETYLKHVYQTVHQAGKKRLYNFRLLTPERGAAAGLRQISLGVLLGLADFRMDAFYLGLHAKELQKKHWKSLFGLSFPRITKAAGDFEVPSPVSDKNLVQMVTALRLFLPDAPFSLSTRESESLRKNLLPLGFTQMSAGSCTEPGGYGQEASGNEQFAVEDTRNVAQIAKELEEIGLEPVWKDWDGGFGTPS